MRPHTYAPLGGSPPAARSGLALAGRVGVVLALLAGCQAPPEPRAYSETESDALRCVWVLSRSATLLEQAGEIDPAELQIIIALSAGILQGHVTGTEAQKLHALEQVRADWGVEPHDEALGDVARGCLLRFTMMQADPQGAAA